VHIFVFNTSGELLIQQRTATKDEFPLGLTSSACGHVDAGESYAQAAVRELHEELSLRCDLEFLTRFPASPVMAYEHSMLYRTITDEQPVFDETEILDGWFHPLKTVEQHLTEEAERYTPVFRVLFRWYLSRYGD